MEHVNDCDCLFIVRLQSFDSFSWRKDLLGRVRRESSWDFKVSTKCWLIRNQWFARIQRACKRVTSSRLMSFVSSTICGVVCSDGIITGTEKIIVNKMMVSGTDKRTYSITKEVGCVSNGCNNASNLFTMSYFWFLTSILDTGCQWTCARWQSSHVQRKGRGLAVWKDVWN